jgi:hypothetical protein
MRTRDTDLIVRMVDFNKPGVGTEQYMSEDSFIENVIENEYFNRRLENGMIKALLTHQGRDYADNDQTETPYDDLIAKHPDLCGVLRDVWVEDHCAFAAIDLLDAGAFPAAAKVKDLIKKGTYVGVSMATECEELSNGDFNITNLLGCDFTLDNFFIGSGIISIKKNFSKVRKNKKVLKLNFANRNSKIFSAKLDKKRNILNFNNSRFNTYVICLRKWR